MPYGPGVTGVGQRLPRRWSRGVAVTACLLLVLPVALALTGPSSSAVVASSSKGRSTRWLVRHLVVGSTDHAGYDRSKFKLWDSIGGGCTTRDVVLYRDAYAKPAVASGCTLTGGRWVSPYDGVKTSDPSVLQIDHVVPLADAWGGGAWNWDARTRERYANDLGTMFDLIAVSAHTNESKGDRDPQHWLPPKASFDCQYMADYTAVLWRWQLHITHALKQFLKGRLKTCGWPRITEPARPAIYTNAHPTPTQSPAPSASVTPSTTATEASPTPTATATTASPPASATPTATATTPTAPATHACTRTSSGSCIRGGEFCPTADYGQTGYDANGDPLTCEGDTTHPRWE